MGSMFVKLYNSTFECERCWSIKWKSLLSLPDQSVANRFKNFLEDVKKWFPDHPAEDNVRLIILYVPSEPIEPKYTVLVSFDHLEWISRNEAKNFNKLLKALEDLFEEHNEGGAWIQEIHADGEYMVLGIYVYRSDPVLSAVLNACSEEKIDYRERPENASLELNVYFDKKRNTFIIADEEQLDSFLEWTPSSRKDLVYWGSIVMYHKTKEEAFKLVETMLKLYEKGMVDMVK